MENDIVQQGLLALLWDNFENHPNLLPAFFTQDPRAADFTRGYVKKPLFSREGANVEIFSGDGLRDRLVVLMEKKGTSCRH